MKNRLLWTTVILAASLLIISDTWAVDNALHRKTLAGVPSINILVEPLSDDLKQAGLSEATLQTDAELRLRAAGIRVATEQESISLPGSPYLYINVGGMRTTTTGITVGYSATVNVELIQDVRLDRHPSIRIDAPTWSVGEIVTGPTVEVIRMSVRDLVDHFANAYLSANPRR